MRKVKQEDKIQSTKSYKKACEGADQRGCKELGRHYLMGYGIRKNRNKGIRLLKTNCHVNNSGCQTYVGFVGINKRYRDLDVFEYNILRKSCEQNSSSSCNDLGFLSLEVYQDYTKAENFFTKACELQNEESCKILGFMYDSKYTGKKDLKKSFFHFNRACELGNGYACFYTGIKYFDGEGVKKNLFKSTALYQKSCNLGNSRGCGALATRYYLGKGIKMDKVKAIPLYKQSCDEGNHLSCIKYIGFSVGE